MSFDLRATQASLGASNVNKEAISDVSNKIYDTEHLFNCPV